jgi:hypothetical protein
VLRFVSILPASCGSQTRGLERGVLVLRDLGEF